MNSPKPLRPKFLTPIWLLVVTAAAALGCSTVHTPDEPLLPPDAAPLAKPVVPYRVGMMPLVITDEFKAHAAAVNSAGILRGYSYPPTPEISRSVVEQVVENVGRLKACKELRMLPGADQRPLDQVLADAWTDGLDLVIRPVVRRRDAEYVDTVNDVHIFTIIVWLVITQPITWGLADETFACEWRVQLEIYSTAGDSHVVAGREIAARIQADLDDFDQGFNYVNVFITPSGLSPGHWEDIGNTLMPEATFQFQRQFIDAFTHADGIAAELSQAASALQRTLVVVADSPDTGDASDVSETDADRVLAQLLKSIPERTVKRVRDPKLGMREATLQGIDQLLRRRAGAGDRVVLFLSGHGRINRDGSAVLFSTPSESERGLTVQELASALSELPSVVVIAVVNWDVEDDSVDPNSKPAPEPLAALAALPNLALFEATTAAAPQPLVIESSKCSLFVDELLDALAKASTDADHDGWLSLAEIAAVVSPHVTEVAGREGTIQLPRLSGSAPIAARPLIMVRQK